MPLLRTAAATAPRGVFGLTLTGSLQRDFGNQFVQRLLQRAYGNQAVQRLIARQAAPPAGPAVQRQLRAILSPVMDVVLSPFIGQVEELAGSNVAGELSVGPGRVAEADASLAPFRKHCQYVARYQRDVNDLVRQLAVLQPSLQQAEQRSDEAAPGAAAAAGPAGPVVQRAAARWAEPSDELGYFTDWLIERLVDVRDELGRHGAEIADAVQRLAALPKRSDGAAPGAAAAAGPAVQRDALVPELMPAVAPDRSAVEGDAYETFRRNGEELTNLGDETDFLHRQLDTAHWIRAQGFGSVKLEHDMHRVDVKLGDIGRWLRTRGKAIRRDAVAWRIVEGRAMRASNRAARAANGSSGQPP